MSLPAPQPLNGTRVLSLALNLPASRPHALRAHGRPAPSSNPWPAAPHTSADPMALYSPQAYTDMHQGIRVVQAHLKTEEGQAALHAELERTDVLITSFRPSALTKLGLGWDALHARYPRLSWCASWVPRVNGPKSPATT